MLLPFQLSANTTGEMSSNNPIIRLLRTRTAAVVMVLVSLLYPLEAFSSNCNMQSPLVCLNATPCQVISGVNVCLAGTTPLPVGALQSIETCWAAQATYSCVDPFVVNDTCAPLKANPKCGVIGSKCIDTSSTGACLAYTDTYQCQTGGGLAGTTTSCSGLTFCSGGTCYTKQDKPNNALGKVVSAMETARQSGAYFDASTMTIFKGVQSWCSENTAGLAYCCKPDKTGMSFTDAVIVDQLIKSGWNLWVKDVIGSPYTFDTLYDMAAGFVDKAISVMSDVVNQSVQAGANTAVMGVNTTAAATAQAGATTATAVGNGTQTAAAVQNPAGAGVGGMLGGTVGTMAGSTLAGNNGGNTAAQGIAGAAGYAGGSAVGTLAGAYAYGYVAGAVSATGTAAGTASAAYASCTICWVCIIAVVIMMIIMALLACSPDEVKTSMRIGAGLCHEVGSYCTAREIGTQMCQTIRHQQCCFNSKLARIIQEQGRPQLGKVWGDPHSPDCSGYTAAQLQSLDFSKMDLSEFVADVTAKAIPDAAALAASVKARLNAFYSTVPASSMNGVIPGPTPNNNVPTLTVSMVSPPPVPPMPACNWTVAKQAPASNGNQTGTFTVTSCLPNGLADWAYIGNCPALQGIAPTDTMIDANGNTAFTITIPAVCQAPTAAGVASMTNSWGVKVFDTPTQGVSGTFRSTW